MQYFIQKIANKQNHKTKQGIVCTFMFKTYNKKFIGILYSYKCKLNKKTDISKSNFNYFYMIWGI